MYSLIELKTLVSCGRDPARSLPLRRGFLLIPLILACFAFLPQMQARVYLRRQTGRILAVAILILPQRRGFNALNNKHRYRCCKHGNRVGSLFSGS